MMYGDQGGGDPAQLQALLQQLGGGQASPDQVEQGGSDPLAALQQVIQDMHTLVSTLPDSQHTQMAVQALGILTKIQADLMPSQKGK